MGGFDPRPTAWRALPSQRRHSGLTSATCQSTSCLSTLSGTRRQHSAMAAIGRTAVIQAPALEQQICLRVSDGRIAGASSRNLSRLFAAHANMTVSDAVNRGRVALARDLIERTELSMERVAERCGFGSARHVRRVWRQFHPATPIELRRTSSSSFANV